MARSLWKLIPALTDNWELAWAEQLAKRQMQLMENNSLDTKRDTAISTGTHSIHRYIEIGLIADRRFLDFHNNTDYEQYLLTVMNMVSDFYHDSSVGNQIDVVLVRVIYLEKEKEEVTCNRKIKNVGHKSIFKKYCKRYRYLNNFFYFFFFKKRTAFIS